MFTDHRDAVVQTKATCVYRIDDGRVGPVDLAAPRPATLAVRLVLEAPDAFRFARWW